MGKLTIYKDTIMKGKIETSSTLSLPIVDKNSASPIIIPFGSDTLEEFMNSGIISAYKFFNIGENLVKTPNNSYSVTLNEKSEVILVVDLGSITNDPGCGQTCRTWQPNT